MTKLEKARAALAAHKAERAKLAPLYAEVKAATESGDMDRRFMAVNTVRSAEGLKLFTRDEWNRICPE